LKSLHPLKDPIVDRVRNILLTTQAGTSVAVQQKLMRHPDIYTTMNIYGDVVTDEIQ
jgi:hypothetical protein